MFLDDKYGVLFVRFFIPKTGKTVLKSYKSTPNNGPKNRGKHAECLFCDDAKIIIPQLQIDKNDQLEILLIINKTCCEECSKKIREVFSQDKEASSGSTDFQGRCFNITIKAQHLFQWQDEGNKRGIRRLLDDGIEVEAVAPLELHDLLCDIMREKSGENPKDVLHEDPEDNNDTNETILDYWLEITRKSRVAELVQQRKTTTEGIRKLRNPTEIDKIQNTEYESCEKLIKSKEMEIKEIISKSQADSDQVLQDVDENLLSMKRTQQGKNIAQGYQKKKELKGKIATNLSDMRKQKLQWVKEEKLKLIQNKKKMGFFGNGKRTRKCIQADKRQPEENDE